MRLRSLLALLLTACTPSLTTVPAGSEFELSPGETVLLGSTDVALSMIDIANDSRCPVDVVCVTAGDAEVRFRVRAEGNDVTVSLHTMQEPRAVTVGAVRLELTSLAPPNHAGSPIPPGEYRAHIRWSTP
jgi:hypothetical protein